MTTLKPLPCPVCKKQPKLDHYVNYAGEWSVACASYRKTYRHDLSAWAATAEKAIKRWNRMVSK